MRDITLEGANWQSKEDFYANLLTSLGAPDWHGHNLDALWDSIVHGDINQLNPPFRIRITGIDQMAAECKALVGQFVMMISEVNAERLQVEVVVL